VKSFTAESVAPESALCENYGVRSWCPGPLSVLSVNNYFAFNVNAYLLSIKQRYSLF